MTTLSLRWLILRQTAQPRIWQLLVVFLSVFTSTLSQCQKETLRSMSTRSLRRLCKKTVNLMKMLRHGMWKSLIKFIRMKTLAVASTQASQSIRQALTMLELVWRISTLEALLTNATSQARLRRITFRAKRSQSATASRNQTTRWVFRASWRIQDLLSASRPRNRALRYLSEALVLPRFTTMVLQTAAQTLGIPLCSQAQWLPPKCPQWAR